jgi:hypothetical protein
MSRNGFRIFGATLGAPGNARSCLMNCDPSDVHAW